MWIKLKSLRVYSVSKDLTIVLVFLITLNVHNFHEKIFFREVKKIENSRIMTEDFPQFFYWILLSQH
jgi:hypothetical protein